MDNIMDILFYLLDIWVAVMLFGWVRNSVKIRVSAKLGYRWLVPSLFIVVLIVGLFRYQGLFTIIQSVCLLVFAVLYWFVGSGLSDEGIVLNGVLTKWEDAGEVTVKKNDCCLIFRQKGRDTAMYFDADQLEVMRKFVADAAYQNHHRK